MMHSKCQASAIALVFVLAQLPGQSRQVKIRFEIDGKPQAGPKSIDLYGPDGRQIASPVIRGGGFDVPDLESSKEVEVRIKLAKRTMAFQGVYQTKFDGAWTVGIDRPPFDDENASPKLVKLRPKELWFIKFEPSSGDGTRIVVIPR